jgi:hypothetical protein
MPRTELRANKQYKRNQKVAKNTAKEDTPPVDQKEAIERLAEEKYQTLIDHINSTSHHCQLKNFGHAHTLTERCLKLDHAGCCPECGHLVHTMLGCQSCGRRKGDLLYDTREAAMWLTKREYRKLNEKEAAGVGGGNHERNA